MPNEANPSHLPEAASLYGVAADALEKLGAFESDVYAFSGPQGPSILKVMDPEYRTVETVQAEVDWLLALRESGVSVAEPLRSVAGSWVESVAADDGGAAKVLVAFRRSPGKETRPDDWTDERVEGWGELLGRLQSHSRAWTPPGPRRPRLIDKSYLKSIADVVPDDPAFVAAAEELAQRTEATFARVSDKGLIHADLHHGNLLLDQERWTAIDFDDAAYGTYAYDLAMPLYYAVRSRTEPPPDEAAGAFLGPFLRGFRRHAPDPDTNAEEMSLYLCHRDAELVMALRTKLSDDDWTDGLRATEAKLRRRVGEGREVISSETLARWF